MNIAVIGSDYLTPEQTSAAVYVLDSFFCRYATGAPVLITQGKPGVELIARRLAKTWNWANTLEYKPDSGKFWGMLKWQEIHAKIAKDCHIVICVRDRYLDTRNKVADKARRYNKKVIEVFV